MDTRSVSPGSRFDCSHDALCTVSRGTARPLDGFTTGLSTRRARVGVACHWGVRGRGETSERNLGTIGVEHPRIEGIFGFRPYSRGRRAGSHRCGAVSCRPTAEGATPALEGAERGPPEGSDEPPIILPHGEHASCYRRLLPPWLQCSWEPVLAQVCRRLAPTSACAGSA